MNEGDLELNLMYYWIKELKGTPSEFYNLSKREKAMIYAIMDISIEEHKKAMKKAKSK